MRYREVIRRMKEVAVTAEHVHTVGSHEKWVVDGHCVIMVPRKNTDMPTGTVGSIQRQGAHCLGERWLR